MPYKKDGHQTPLKVTRHAVAHVTFEVRENAHGGNTFALVAGDAAQAKDRRPFFTGFIEPGMAAQLRDLARKLDQMAAKELMSK
jgi:hypothetical protein